MADESRGRPDWKSVSDPSGLELPPGSNSLIASAESPTQHGLGLRALCQNGDSDDVALVVTTLTGSEETLHAYGTLCSERSCPSLRLVDTTADRPSGRRSYNETPVVLIPDAGGLERIVLALSDLTDDHSIPEGNRHLLVDSLTPILQAATTSSVCRMIDRITGIRSEDGYCLFGLDYTAHSTETMTAVTEHVDGILWVTHSDDTVNLEYRATRGGHLRTPVEAAGGE